MDCSLVFISSFVCLLSYFFHWFSLHLFMKFISIWFKISSFAIIFFIKLIQHSVRFSLNWKQCTKFKNKNSTDSKSQFSKDLNLVLLHFPIFRTKRYRECSTVCRYRECSTFNGLFNAWSFRFVFSYLMR